MGLSIEILLFILPLIYLPFIFNPYESAKFAVFVAVVLVIGVIHFSKKNKLRNLIRKHDLLKILIITYGLTVLISDIFGFNLRNSILGSGYRFQGFITLFCGILFYFVVRDMGHENSKFVAKAKTAIFLSAFFVCVFSLWQGISFYFLHDLAISTYQGRIVGTIGNPNSLGGYLAITFSLLLFTKNKNYKHFILAVMMVVVILLTQSRGAILATCFVLTIYGTLFLRKLWFWKIVLAAAIIIILLFLIKIGRGSIWDSRRLIWNEGVKATINRPILGYGQENFELIFPKERKMLVDSAHNIFLETAVSSGLVGLTAFLSIIALALKRADLSIRMALLVFLISGQFNPLSISQIALFWFLLGTIP